MKLLVSLLAILLSTHTFAIEKSYTKLNQKLDYCTSLPETKFEAISDPWLVGQPLTSRKVALLMVKDYLIQECARTEVKEFLYQAYLSHSRANDSEAIKSFLALKKNSVAENYRDIVDSDFLEQVARLAESGMFGENFDVLTALNAIGH
ncbi:hypothetical protein [Vibrio mexicanus]|uniref:hypothetical protein n=1 Tax=Vibrio mexicanus TaxID=1004326 RepID=UPI00063CB230|nr:hypothetical protein [Vibrio mexicanus]